MDEHERRLLGARLMAIIVAKSEGDDDLEKRISAEVVLNISPREPKQTMRLRKDGKFGRERGSKAQDILTGQWVVSEELIDRMRPLAYRDDGIPGDLLAVESMLLWRSYEGFRGEVDAFRKVASRMMGPLLKAAARTDEPSYARGLVADALNSLVPADTLDGLPLPAAWGPDPGSKLAGRYIDLEEAAKAALRPRRKRRRNSVKR